jgi:hypothetical protein
MQIPRDLSEPERRLWDSAETGAWVNLAEDDVDEARDPKDGARWGADRVIHAEVIAEILTRNLPAGRRALRLRQARIVGRLDLEAAELLCPLEFRECFFDEPILINEATAPKVALLTCYFPYLMGHQLRTRGDVSLTDSHALAIHLPGAHIGGQLNLSGVHLSNPDGWALYADRARIDESMICSDKFRTDGELRLLGAHIGGQLNLKGAHLNNPNGRALHADRARIDEGIHCSEDFRTDGELRLLGAHIGGQLNLKGAHLNNPNGDALSADGIQVEEDVFCADAFRAEGKIRLPGARIGGQLNLKGAHLNNPNDNAFVADRACINESIICTGGFNAQGGLRLPGAQIRGQLNLNGAHLNNPGGVALAGDGIQIDGDLFCRNDSEVEGQIRLPGAHISGQFDLTDAHLAHSDNYALIAHHARFDEGMLCTGKFRAEGQLSLIGAQVEGRLDLSEAQLSGPIETVLDLRQAKIAHLMLPKAREPEGILDLRDAHITHLDDAWPATSYDARIDGLAYETISPLPRGAAARLQWLSHTTGGFLPQPYEQLVAVLRRGGRDDDARRVSMAKEKSRRSEMRLAGQLWNWFLGMTVGYGYQPWRGRYGLAC